MAPKVKSNKDLTKQVNKLVKKVADLKPEMKYLFTSYAVNPSTTVQYALLNGMAEGDSADERLGAKLRMKFITVKYDLYTDGNVGSGEWQNYRIMIVQDRQTNLATPPASQADGPLFSTSLTTWSPLDPKWDERYKILHDEYFALNKNSDNVNGHRTRSFKINLHNSVVTFDGTGATIASIASNSLYIMYFNTEATAQSTFQIKSLLRYTDV